MSRTGDNEPRALLLDQGDVKAHQVKRFDFPVYSLGPWTPLGHRTFSPLGNALHALKYGDLDARNWHSAVVNLVEMMIPELKRMWPQKPSGPIVIVPSNRDYSRSLLPAVARVIADRTQIPFRESALSKVRKLPLMKRTMRSARPKVIRGAYIAKPPLEGRTGSILIDDVFDSGATMREARRALTNAGWDANHYNLALAHIERPFSGWEALK